MRVTEEQFVFTLDKWMFDVRAEAIELFRAGVAHDHALQCAMKVVEGKTITRARQHAELGLTMPPGAALS